MAHLDIDTIATFLAVVDTGSFTEAGRRVGRTQASVSAAIARLEDRLGKRLLNRTARTITFTPAGNVFVGYARKLLALEEEAVAAIRGPSASSHVRIGMPDDYIALFGNAAMRQYAVHNRNVSIEVVCEFSHDLEVMVGRGDIDLAIVTRRGSQAQGELIKTERQVWCAAVGAYPERNEELPLALFPEDCRARPGILKALDEAGRRYRIVWVSSHMQSVQLAVTSGLAVTALPQSALTFEHRVLTAADGLPELPDLELELIPSPGISMAGRRLADFFRSMFPQPSQAAMATT